MKGVFYFKLNKWNENKGLSSLRVPHIYYLTQPFQLHYIIWFCNKPYEIKYGVHQIYRKRNRLRDCAVGKIT